MENGQWIQRHLSELAESTKIDGKIWRASYTEEDGIGHRMFRRWIEEAGLEWREDVLGNIYGRLPGRRSGDHPVGVPHRYGAGTEGAMTGPPAL